MCRPVGAVLTRDNEFLCEDDSHESTIKRKGLREMFGGHVQVVRVELLPPGRNFMAPRAEWTYNLDQDELPEWYDADDCERRMRAAAEDWWSSHHVSEGIVQGWAGGTLILSGTAQSHGQTGGYCRCFDSATNDAAAAEVSA